MIIREYDPIDIPSDLAREQEPIHVTQTGHPAWPGAEFTILFDWNTNGEFWTWEVSMPEAGVIVPRQPAEYGQQYRFGEYVLFMFIDLSTQDVEVMPSTLGSSVDLVAIPGLRSPGFGDWLDRQTTDAEERAELLNAWEENVMPDARS